MVAMWIANLPFTISLCILFMPLIMFIGYNIININVTLMCWSYSAQWIKEINQLGFVQSR